jgi:hypothetical protein
MRAGFCQGEFPWMWIDARTPVVIIGVSFKARRRSRPVDDEAKVGNFSQKFVKRLDFPEMIHTLKPQAARLPIWPLTIFRFFSKKPCFRFRKQGFFISAKPQEKYPAPFSSLIDKALGVNGCFNPKRPMCRQLS